MEEEGVGDDGDLGVVRAEKCGEVPVGDGAAAVEKAGLGEGEGAAAEGGDRGPPGMGAAEGVEYRGGCGGDVVVQVGDNDQVGAGEPAQGAVGGEGESAP